MSTVHLTRRPINIATVILAATILMMAIFAVLPQNGQAGFHGNFGNYVDSVSDKDFTPLLDTMGAGRVCLGYIDDPDSSDFDDRAYVLHIEPTTDCATVQKPQVSKTWLFTLYGGGTANRWVTSGDSAYTVQDFTSISQVSSTSNFLCYLESDGVNGYSQGDTVYIKNGLSTTATLQEHDLRIGPTVSGLSAYSASFGFVKNTDQDFTRATATNVDPTRLPVDENLSCGGFSVKMLTLGQIGTISNQNVYYLVHSDMDSTVAVAPGMVRMTSVSGVSGHGSKVLGTNSDSARLLEVLSAGDVQIASTEVISGTNEIPNRGVVLHVADPAGNDDFVRMHDLYIKRGTGTSASSPGTLVTSASTSSQSGARSPIESGTPGTLANLEERVFFIDKNGNNLLDEGDHVYIKHPSNTRTSSGGSCTAALPGTMCVAEHDIRVNVPGVSGATSGSLVKPGDGDWVNRNTAGMSGDFVLKLFSEKTDTRLPLKSVTEGKYHDDNSNNRWDPATEDVYLESGSTVVDGSIRVWTGGAPVWQTVSCPANADCGDALTAGNVKSSGPDGSYRTSGHGIGERLYWSEDGFLTLGDKRLGDVMAGATVGKGDADVDPGTLFQSSSVTLYLSWDTSGTFAYPTANDFQIFPSFGTRLTHSSTDVVPKVTTATPDLVRSDLGDTGLQDDGYYLDFSAGNNFQSGRVLRLTPADGKSAGSFVQSGDTSEIQSGQSSTFRANNGQNFFGYIDTSPTGYGTSDFVYLNLPSSIGGSTGGTLSQWDSRLTPVSLGSFSAGTRVLVGDLDHQTYGGDSFSGLTDGQILWWDANGDGIVNQHDALWLRLRTDLAAGAPPTFLDVRLNGPPASSGGGSGGGGSGGGTTPTTPDNRPTAEFTVDVDGRTITLDASGSSAISGRTLATYAWDFGDDNEESGSSPTAMHTYDEEGQYTVRLTVTDSQGETRTTTRTVQTENYDPGDDDTGTTDDDGMDDGAADDDADDGDGEEEDTPGPALLMVLAAVGAALVALRRRR